MQFAGDERPMRFGRAVIGHPASEAAEFARGVVGSIARETPDKTGKSPAARTRAATMQEKAFQVQLLRDLFGNPFRPFPPTKQWFTQVRKLAVSIYSEQAFDRLPILAEALEKAGCDNAEILEHCRGQDTHAKGCWVIDVLLGNRQAARGPDL